MSFIIFLFYPSFLVFVAKVLIVNNLNKKKPRTKKEKQILAKKMRRFREDNIPNYDKFLVLLLMSYLLFIFFLGTFYGSFTEETSFYIARGLSSYAFLTLLSVTFVTFLGCLRLKKEFALWKTDIGKNFIENNPKVLVMSNFQKKCIQTIYYISLFLSMLNIFIFLITDLF